MALVFAGLEVEAEGKHGWAEKMPTWYRKATGKFSWNSNDSFWLNIKNGALELFGLAMDGKPLTGYHLFMMPLPLLIVHTHFIMGAEWSMVAELQALAIYFAFIPVWDFLWFVLNPAYTVENFNKQSVWWHGLGPWSTGRVHIPVCFLMGWAISVWLSIFAYFISGDGQVMVDAILLLATFFALTALTVWLSPYYHDWYFRMREQDDRSELGLEEGVDGFDLDPIETT